MIKHFPSQSRIYLDANILIYLIERADPLQQKIVQILAVLEQVDASVFISNIGIAECLYGAHKAKSEKLLQLYNQLFYDNSIFNLVSVDNESVIKAAEIGAEKGLKLVDAVHFLAAIETSCELFLTNDHRFQSSHGIKVLHLSSL